MGNGYKITHGDRLQWACVHSPLVLGLLRWNSAVKNSLARTVMEARNCRIIAENKYWFCMFQSYDNFMAKE